MIIIGLSPIVHESAVGIVVDGRLVAAASEERFTRVKNQGGFPHEALRYCLSAAGVSASDVDAVAYAALPFAKERWRDLTAYAENMAYVAGVRAPLAAKVAHMAGFTRSMILHKEWLSWGGTLRRIIDALREYELDGKLVFVDHHLAHVASAYFTSGEDRALAVSLDGYGSGQAGSFYSAEGGRLELLQAVPYPHSLGTFYRRVTQALGFKPNRHEGKIVGLAAFGDPSVLHDVVRDRFDLTGDDYYRFKDPQNVFFERDMVARYEPKDIAAAYQTVLEEVAVRYVSAYVRRHGFKRLVLAGGVMANVKMNQRLMEIPEVERIYVFPNMGDGGVGVGAALWLASQHDRPEPYRLRDVYLGPSYSDRDYEEALSSASLSFTEPPSIEDEVAGLLSEGKVVARFDGRMEFGPRALGNRSVLCQATDPSINKWLNDRFKRTEFMPFAPISLEKEASKLYVDIEQAGHAAQFMTVTVDCTPRMKSDSPAAVHVDGTARPQLVTEEVQPGVHKILTRYFERTGIPTVINTSFNMHEEPIVCSPQDAVRSFLEGRLDALALGKFLVRAPASVG